MTDQAGSADPARSPRGLLVTPDVLRHGIRFYSSSPGQPRSRRASDTLLLIPCVIALSLMVIGYPVAPPGSPVGTFLASAPAFLSTVWAFFFDLLTLWAVVLIITTLARGRRIMLAQAVASLVLAVALAFIVSRVANGSWPELSAVIGGEFKTKSLPSVRIVQSAVVVLAISPHLTRPLQAFTRWILFLGVIAAFFADSASVGGNVMALLIAVIAATAVRLAFGTSAGYPELDEVAGALKQLGVPVSGLERVDRGESGAFEARGRDPQGDPLVVKVYGRDAYDNQLVEKLWRTVWYRDPGPGPSRQPLPGSRARGLRDAPGRERGRAHAPGGDRRHVGLRRRAAGAARQRPAAGEPRPPRSSTTPCWSAAGPPSCGWAARASPTCASGQTRWWCTTTRSG